MLPPYHSHPVLTPHHPALWPSLRPRPTTTIPLQPTTTRTLKFAPLLPPTPLLHPPQREVVYMESRHRRFELAQAGNKKGYDKYTWSQVLRPHTVDSSFCSSPRPPFVL